VRGEHQTAISLERHPVLIGIAHTAFCRPASGAGQLRTCIST